MLFEGEIGVALQLSGQPLPQRLALNRGPAWDLVDGDIAREAPPFEPAFDGGAGDPEELLDLLPWDATV